MHITGSSRKCVLPHFVCPLTKTIVNEDRQPQGNKASPAKDSIGRVVSVLMTSHAAKMTKAIGTIGYPGVRYGRGGESGILFSPVTGRVETKLLKPTIA